MVVFMHLRYEERKSVNAYEHRHTSVELLLFSDFFFLLQGASDVEVSGSPTEKAILHWGIQVCFGSAVLFPPLLFHFGLTFELLSYNY